MKSLLEFILHGENSLSLEQYVEQSLKSLALGEYAEEQNYQQLFENYSNNIISNVLSNINKSLLIWSKSGISSLNYLFEQSKYNFDNCDNVLEEIIDKLYNIEIKEQTLEFYFNNVFFKYLIVEINIGNSILGSHEKKKLSKNTISFNLTLLKNKPIDEYNLREQRMLRYMIIHELTHAYEHYLKNQEGDKNGIFYPEDSKEYKKYYIAINWILSGIKLPQLKEELILCGYFLDEHEKFAYLGTVKETVKNVIDAVIPSYKNLKFNEIIKKFENEFNWNEYIKISAFIDRLRLEKQNKDLRYKIWRLYNSIYNENISEDEIINELIEKWDDFKKEFEYTFMEAYADHEKNFKLESFIDIDFKNRIND